MNRRASITFFFVAFALSAGIAYSASIEDGILAQLTRQGFTDISTETTWLGRLRILAQRKDGSREIVLNPRTGEILRDQFTALDGTEAVEPILDEVGGGTSGSDSNGTADNGSGGSGSGSSGSGSNGSGSSGSGSSGSGSTGSGGSGSGGSGSGSSGSADDGADGNSSGGSGSGHGGSGSGSDGGGDKNEDNGNDKGSNN